MWIEFDNQLINLNLIENVRLEEIENSMMELIETELILSSTERDYTEFYGRNNQQAQDRYNEIKKLLLNK